MGASPAFSFYAKDFLTGTAAMSLAEVGAYVKLLAYQWDAGAVPFLNRDRARILGCSVTQERNVWARISDKFELVEHAYQNERLETERRKQAERRERLADNGRLGGRPVKLEVKQTETNSFPVAKPNENLDERLPSSSSSSSSSTKTTARPLTAKRNLHAEYEHPRFDVPTSWHLRTVKGLSNGEPRLMKFYAWLAERVERTNEDTLPRFEWLDARFKEWMESGPVRSSVPSPAETSKMIADRIAMAGR